MVRDHVTCQSMPTASDAKSTDHTKGNQVTSKRLRAKQLRKKQPSSPHSTTTITTTIHSSNLIPAAHTLGLNGVSARRKSISCHRTPRKKGCCNKDRETIPIRNASDGHIHQQKKTEKSIYHHCTCLISSTPSGPAPRRSSGRRTALSIELSQPHTHHPLTLAYTRHKPTHVCT